MPHEGFALSSYSGQLAHGQREMGLFQEAGWNLARVPAATAATGSYGMKDEALILSSHVLPVLSATAVRPKLEIVSPLGKEMFK